MSDLRASDADREAVVGRLHEAAAEGRLDADELEERVGAAYAARTEAELAALTADLPVSGPPARAELTPRERLAASREWRSAVAGMVVTAIVCVAVWLATGANGYFWPVWPILGTGIGAAVTTAKAAFDLDDDRRERRRELDERRSERRELRGR